MSAGSDWSDQELEATAEAYLWMLQQEQSGKLYGKAEVNRALREGALAQRSKQSIEYRMRNISAVLEEAGHPRIKGYVPATNVGEGVKARIMKALEAKGFDPASAFQPTADEAELQRRVSKLRKRNLVSVPAGQAAPASTTALRKAFVRDPVVKAWVLRNSGGICEACGCPAPFTGDDGEPFLEVHHPRLLADGGSDTITNAVAVCPNCHRRCHVGADRVAFTDSLYKRVARLIRE